MPAPGSDDRPPGRLATLTASTPRAQQKGIAGGGDLAGWLRERHTAGWSLSRLGHAVGHSTHWVRWRLEAPTPHYDAAPGPPDAGR